MFLLADNMLGPYPDIMPLSNGDSPIQLGGVMMPQVLEYRLNFPELSTT